MSAFLNLVGEQFGRLVVRSRVDGTPVRWRCTCMCGRSCVVRARSLRSGKTRSCGCLRREACGMVHRVHGMSDSPEHRAWAAMKSRCTNPNTRDWPNYGGGGIRVCAKWAKSFAAFYADVGPRPSSLHTIERDRVNGHYKPGNVRWATRAVQNRNTRATRWITFRGKTQSAAAWAEQTGLGAALYTRLHRGWAIKRAITQPVTRAKRELVRVAGKDAATNGGAA